MRYSRWRPDRGGYDYYEASDRIGLGDDLPVPTLSGGTDLGIPSTDIGRPLPSGARKIGSGELPIGSITPMPRIGLGLRGLGAFGISLDAIGALAIGIGLGWYWWGRRRSG